MDERQALHRNRGAAILAPVLLCLPVGLWADTYHLPLLPPASDPFRQGVVRIVNHSAETGDVAITAIDDAGYIYGPLNVTVEGQHALQLSSGDLEQGNPGKGLSAGVGVGLGDWRLVLETSLDIEPAAYVQTASGFVDRIHDLLPPKWFGHRLTLVGPDSGAQHEGQLRLINPADSEAQVWIFGVDDDGRTVPGHVALSVPAGTARTIAASELQNGASGLTGQLGEGGGDWQLLVFADPSVEAMTLLDSVSGPLANLSAAVTDPTEIAFFPSSGNASRLGTLRIANRSGAGDIEIRAIDDAGSAFGPIVLKFAGRGTRQLSSADLESGNTDKGLLTGFGRGEGDWRLSLKSDLNLDVVAYARTRDGFATAIDDVAARGDRRHHVPWFNPASETQQVSRLRLINPADRPADVVIRAWDDEGDTSPEGAVGLTLAAGASRTVTSTELEEGAEGLTGSLGDGEGKWRLSVQADRPIRVMSLVESSNGHLTNVSTPASLPRFLNSCIGGPADADGDGVSDHCDRDPATALRPLSGCDDGTYIQDAHGNPALAGDCRVLIGIANVQAQNDDLPDDHVLRQWGVGEDAAIGTWEGIVVTEGRIAEIRLAGTSEKPGGLTGFIPLELAQLSELVVLDLSHNRLTGPLPPSLGRLENLTQLSLNDNDLTRGIPSELGSLSKLTWLRLDGNRLSGSIPSELGQLTNLVYLLLSRNRLNGPIPAELGKLTKLSELRLHSNRLSGPIPSELGRLTNLWFLYLADNALTGPIPGELGQLSALTHLYLHDNAISGPIPAQLGNLSKLSDLRLQSNRLSGEIPTELGQLANLVVLFLQDNVLTGPIPNELGQLSALTYFHLHDNAVSGPIPAQLGNLSRLSDLRLQSNRLSGEIPAELGRLANLVGLFLQDNVLTGPIPNELGQLSHLNSLHLNHNALSGAVPAQLENLSKLSDLRLQSNRLSGEIPAELGQLSALTHLYLHDNAISGPIPAQLGNLSKLSDLRLQSNRLSGEIPAELGRLANLVGLFLQDNVLTGPIPNELGQLSHLNSLHLNNNALSGAIPAQLGSLGRLTHMSLRDNRLSGPIPSAFGRLVSLEELDLTGNRLSGAIPDELASLTKLTRLLLSSNRLTGTVPWSFWERVTQRELLIQIQGNLIGGFERPPQRSAVPVYSRESADNGNASHHSVAYYQGPLAWSWNWQDAAVEHQKPILGRWAALAVRIDHEVPQAPLVITRVLDSDDGVLTDRLMEAAPPTTRPTGSGQWRTEYVFELPGSLYQAGNQIVHVIDPDGELAETDENDNVGEAIALYGDQPPKLRVTFVPLVHTTDAEPPRADAEVLMAGIRALLPFADEFEAMVSAPVTSEASGKYELFDEIRALWNAEADADEFYHGVFRFPWPGEGEHKALGGGVAEFLGRVAVSEVSAHYVIPHELGHNLGLRHAPGCDAVVVDDLYPYPDGGLGPNPGWDLNWRRLVSRDDAGYTDVMSICRELSFISDYHYRKALDHWLAIGLEAETSSASPFSLVEGALPQGPASASPSPASAGQASLTSKEEGGLALSGRMDASGTWSLLQSEATEKGPRPPAPDGAFTLILFDEAGVELYREPLSLIAHSHGGGAGWAARTPTPPRPAREMAILDAQGTTVFRDALPPVE